MLGYFGQWATKPWSEDNDLGQWFLFVGLMVVSLIVWLGVLHYILEEV